MKNYLKKYKEYHNEDMYGRFVEWIEKSKGKKKWSVYRRYCKRCGCFFKGKLKNMSFCIDCFKGSDALLESRFFYEDIQKLMDKKRETASIKPKSLNTGIPLFIDKKAKKKEDYN
jgi:hypothetical protein